MISPKVTIPTIAAAVLTLVCAGLRHFGVELGATEQAAATVLLVAILGYIVPDPARVV